MKPQGTFAAKQKKAGIELRNGT